MSNFLNSHGRGRRCVFIAPIASFIFCAYANSAEVHLKLCNNGNVSLNYGTLTKTTDASYQLDWYDVVQSSSCKIVHSGVASKTFFFMLVDKNTGNAYNPIYKPTQAIAGNSHITKLCVPSGGAKTSRTISVKILEKMSKACPKRWVSIETSFTTGFNFTTEMAVYTLDVSADANDFSNRMW